MWRGAGPRGCGPAASGSATAPEASAAGRCRSYHNVCRWLNGAGADGASGGVGTGCRSRAIHGCRCGEAAAVRPPRRAAVECQAVAKAATDQAGASNARERPATGGEQQRLDGGRPSSRRGHGCVTGQGGTAHYTAAFSAGGAGRRIERRPSVEPSRKQRPTERARAGARALSRRAASSSDSTAGGRRAVAAMGV